MPLTGPLNYHHLLYFWTVAREGSIARATERLNLSQPAISAQIRSLERSIGEKLFAKRGRNLVLTEVGQLVFRYADEIFTVGRELQATLAGGSTSTARPPLCPASVSCSSRPSVKISSAYW